jgi:hypothetical protein
MAKKNQIDPTQFNSFNVENVDAYLGLQAFISIFKSIQTPTIVGGCTITTTKFTC